VFVTLAGTITESTNDPTSDLILGIAGAGPGTANLDLRSGTNTWPVGRPVPVLIPNPGDKFLTTNFAAVAANGFGDVAPVVADIGDDIGMELIGGEWGLAADATNDICRIYDVLNQNLDPIRLTGETLTASTTNGSYYVVFEIVAHQSLPVTGLAQVPGA